MTKEEIKKEIEDMKEHFLGVEEDIKIKAIKSIKNKDELNIWDFNFLSNCSSDLQIISIKIKLIDEILKLF